MLCVAHKHAAQRGKVLQYLHILLYIFYPPPSYFLFNQTFHLLLGYVSSVFIFHCYIVYFNLNFLDFTYDVFETWSIIIMKQKIYFAIKNINDQNYIPSLSIPTKISIFVSLILLNVFLPSLQLQTKIPLLFCSYKKNALRFLRHLVT